MPLKINYNNIYVCYKLYLFILDMLIQKIWPYMRVVLLREQVMREFDVFGITIIEREELDGWNPAK